MAALAPTRPAHLGRTVPTGAVPAAAPPAHTHPGPAWWSAARPRRGAAEEPPPRSALSPGATAVSSSRPGAPPAPSAAPAPRAPSRSADPAQPRRDARVARSAPAPDGPRPGRTRTPHSRRRHGRTRPRSRSQQPFRLHPALAIRAAPPPMASAGVCGESLGKLSGRGQWAGGTEWSRCVPHHVPRLSLPAGSADRTWGREVSTLLLLPTRRASVWA